MPEEAAGRMAGVELRLPTCQWKRVQRQGQDIPEFRPTPQCANLREMQETPAGSCMRVLGADVQQDGGHHLEFKEVGKASSAALHCK